MTQITPKTADNLILTKLLLKKINMIGENALHFIEYELQAIALIWMALIYIIKIWQLSRMKMPWEQAPQKGSPTQG